MIIITGFCEASRAGKLALFATLTVLQFPLFAVGNSAPEELTAAVAVDAEHLIELYQSVPGLRTNP